MDRQISMFGGKARISVRVSSGQREEIMNLARDIWFDKDIDGRWLVCAQDNDIIPIDANGNDPPAGAIIVRDPAAIAFIEQLAQLVVEPASFEDEPVFVVAGGETTTPT